MAEEVGIEVEAVQAVYGEDCVVIDQFPPHLRVHIKPRTADVSSEQFVEAVLEIRGGSKYPNDPPIIDIVDSKGLDEERKKHLTKSIRDRACELSSCLMLVALCEEAVERLSAMNHPDGDCPLCLYPLFPEQKQNNILSFMKLMSCFHCFHSECVIRWWNWLQSQQVVNLDNSSSETVQSSRETEHQPGTQGMTEESMGNCPVCRKVFHAKDIEHVLGLVGSHALSLGSNGSEISDDDEKLLQSDSEVSRRLKFEATLKLQDENSGLIEPKRNGVIVPGMFLQRPVTPSSAASVEETTSAQQHRDPIILPETGSSGSSTRPSSSEQRNSSMRRHRVRNSRRQVKQWVKKDNGPAN